MGDSRTIRGNSLEPMILEGEEIRCIYHAVLVEVGAIVIQWIGIALEPRILQGKEVRGVDKAVTISITVALSPTRWWGPKENTDAVRRREGYSRIFVRILHNDT